MGDRVKFLNQDLFTTDISEATVVTLYLLPSLNLRLIPKLNSELKPGTRIVSHSFDMGDGQADRDAQRQRPHGLLLDDPDPAVSRMPGRLRTRSRRASGRPVLILPAVPPTDS